MGVKRHYNPERAIHKRVADPKRAKLRAEARAAFARGIARERKIGVDPIFLNLPRRDRVELRKKWLKRSRAYALKHEKVEPSA